MSVFKLEWKAIATNRVLLISLIILLLVPIMYSGIFLSSAWDPYSRTENLPVAVVNLDQSADYGDKTLELGAKLVEQLKDNPNMQWHFVDADQAQQGLERGDYYMVITIPSDFSANASTVLDDTPKAMNLTYQTNPGRNYFASVVSSQAATAVEGTIARSITQEYAQALLDQMSGIGEGFDKAANGSKQLQEGIASAHEGSQKLKDGLVKLADSTLTFSNGVKQLVAAVGTVQAGTAALNDGANQLNAGVISYTTGVSTLYEGSQKFTQGADQLIAASPALLSGAKQLADGAQQLAPGLTALANGANSTLPGSKELTQGLLAVNEATAKLADENAGVASLAKGQKQLQSAMNQLQTGAAALQSGLKQLNGNLPSEEQARQLTQGLTDIQKGINKLSASVSSNANLSSSVASIQTNLQVMQTALTALSGQAQTSSQAVIKVVQDSSGYQSLSSAQQQELLRALGVELNRQSEAQAAQLKNASASLKQLSDTLSTQIVPLVQGLGTLPASIETLNTAVNQVNPKAAAAISAYPTISATLDEKLIPGAAALNQGLADASTGSSQLAIGLDSLNSQMPILADSTGKLASGSQALSEGIDSLSQGSKQLSDAATRFATGSSSFSVGVSQYSQSVEQLNAGAKQIGAGLEQLDAKSSALLQGSESLKDGLAVMFSNLPALADGAAKLFDGTEQFQSGSNALVQGSQDLTEGINKLNSGSSELASELGEGAGRLQQVNTNKANAEMIANPLNPVHTEYSKVPNYGHALAPYVLILGLFVGAIAFNLVFPLTSPAGSRASGLSWWFSKFSVGVLQATFSALVMNVIMLYGMGLQVDHLASFVLLSVLASITFMFLVMLLNVAFGNFGRLLSMLLLVVQLGASGGMMPMELSNSLFNALHRWLPMTYAVEGTREAMSSSMAASQYSNSVLMLIVFMVLFNLLLLGVMHLKAGKESASAIPTTGSHPVEM
ncbi:YhgE/Pip domain-containing protein [Gorillibacterium timonense]|uniref:YhgE/Pip domain-containing protein n=1 Tax=Gorillibacterium timonense TaxID=1689269 RepID=UPI00071C3DFD|nr:YhgE/Pip domain-containing protein [Gorillibacterium timonense]